MNKQFLTIVTIATIAISATSCNSSGDKSNSNTGATEKSKTKEKTDNWVSMTKFNGSSNKNSKSFETKGGDLKISYKVEMTASGKGNDMTDFELSLTDKDQGIWGSPDVMLMNKAETSETSVQKPAGKYFVHIQAVNVKYEVEVFEKQ